MTIITNIEIFLVDNFEEIEGTFDFCRQNLPSGHVMDDFQVNEFRAGYLIKVKIKKQEEGWFIGGK